LLIRNVYRATVMFLKINAVKEKSQVKMGGVPALQTPSAIRADALTLLEFARPRRTTEQSVMLEKNVFQAIVRDSANGQHRRHPVKMAGVPTSRTPSATLTDVSTQLEFAHPRNSMDHHASRVKNATEAIAAVSPARTRFLKESFVLRVVSAPQEVVSRRAASEAWRSR
jgi:hypothetical protein